MGGKEKHLGVTLQKQRGEERSCGRVGREMARRPVPMEKILTVDGVFNTGHGIGSSYKSDRVS